VALTQQGRQQIGLAEPDRAIGGLTASSAESPLVSISSSGAA
jgi:hypothetical protein